MRFGLISKNENNLLKNTPCPVTNMEIKSTSRPAFKERQLFIYKQHGNICRTRHDTEQTKVTITEHE